MGRRRAIVLLVLSSILLITLDVRGSAMIDRARSLFALLVEPFDTAARTITRPVLTAWHGIVDYRDVQRENETLRAEIDNQRGAIIEARAAILEYQELLVLNRLMGSSNFPSVTVQVQGDAPGNFPVLTGVTQKDGFARIAHDCPANWASSSSKVARSSRIYRSCCGSGGMAPISASPAVKAARFSAGPLASRPRPSAMSADWCRMPWSLAPAARRVRLKSSA